MIKEKSVYSIKIFYLTISNLGVLALSKEGRMNIICFSNNGIPYLQLIDCIPVMKDGKKTRKRKVVRNLGPLSRFDDGKPDYLTRLRDSFKAGVPIVKELEDFVDPMRPVTEFTTLPPLNEQIIFNVSKYDPSSVMRDVKNIGFFLLEALYNNLGINDVLSLEKSRKKLDYDVNGIAKMLMIGRVLRPGSKIGTFEDRGRYSFQVTSCDDVGEVYKSLSILDNKADTIQNRINSRIVSTIGRSTQICYYDVTNFWFEISKNDPDLTDSAGNIIQYGLRKRGMSKENRKEPIVQMGLFIDDNGIPIGYQLFPGNNNDQSTLRPAIEKTINHFNFGRVIVVADAGLNGGPNIACLVEQGNGYIVPKSTKSSTKAVKDYMIDENDYTWNEDRTFKSKSKIVDRKIVDSTGKSRLIKEKLVVYWSKKHYDRDVHEMEKIRELLNFIVANPKKVKTNFKTVEKYLVEVHYDPETGERENGVKRYEISMQKLNKELELMGFYSLLTSEIDLSDTDIIHKYHGLSRIEDSFRITKSDLEGRPVFVHTPEHINAHFLICFVALVMIRLIQFKILKFQGKETKNSTGWESGLSANRIQTALNSWFAESFCGYWRLSDVDANEDLKLILQTFGVNWKMGYATDFELRKLKTTFDKAVLILPN